MDLKKYLCRKPNKKKYTYIFKSLLPFCVAKLNYLQFFFNQIPKNTGQKIFNFFLAKYRFTDKSLLFWFAFKFVL